MVVIIFGKIVGLFNRFVWTVLMMTFITIISAEVGALWLLLLALRDPKEGINEDTQLFELYTKVKSLMLSATVLMWGA